MNTVRFDFGSKDGISKSIKRLKNYQQGFPEKLDKFERRLCEEGAEIVRKVFGENHAEIQKIDNGYALLAVGKAVCFIEFGTGFYADTGGSYPMDLPTSINVYPGSWSETHAMTYQQWVDADLPEDEYPYNRTPQHGMVQAFEKMRSKVYEIAKEVFG